MSRPVRVLLGVVLVLVLLLAAAGGLVWWKLRTLKQQLLAGLDKSLGADVQVASLAIDPWKSELHATDITITNQQPSAPWEKGSIAQATVSYHLSDLFSSSVPIKVDISSWNVVLRSPLRTAEAPSDTTSRGGPDASSKPGRLQVNHLTASDGTVEMDFSDDRKFTASGVGFDSTEDGGIWTTQLQASSVKSSSLDIGASSLKIRGDVDKLTFSELHMQCDAGEITGDGEVATGGQHDAQVTIKAIDVPVKMLVSTIWQTEISGLTNLDLKYTGNDQGGSSQGSIVINHGKFNVLPWLSKVTMFVGLPDISGVEVDKATTDFTWKDGALHLANVDIRKNDVTRIAGTVDLDPQGNVDGKLRLGLPSTVTAKWPQLQTSVFSVAFEDYNWADVHVTGTPNNLQEDLTPRLVSAGLNQGGTIINSATKQAGDILNSLLGK